MLKHFLPETTDIIHQAEAETGFHVKLVPSEIHYPARMNLPAYIAQQDGITISYNPRAASPDYAIVHEAVRFLRFWRAPPEQRFVLGSTQQTEHLAYQAMEHELDDKPAKLRPAIRSAFGMLYDGLLTQLYSTPGDFWINQWLYNEYPSGPKWSAGYPRYPAMRNGLSEPR